MPITSAITRAVSRVRRRFRGEAGITMVEMLIATLLFAAIATPLATVLTSSINSHRDSRERTIAQQIAMERIEEVRRMAYEDVGTQGGNPPGELDPSYSVSVKGLNATVNTQVSYVDDPTPTSYATAANYKKVSVSVVAASDSKLLTREVTYVAPPERAPYGGINNAIINVQVVDFATNEPVEGATVDLTGGPPGFTSRSDTSDNAGLVTFPALTPNGVSDYYDLAATLSGYVTLSDDLPPSSASHVQLAPSQTFNTAIRIYQPATIDVVLQNEDGTPYTDGAIVTVSSERGSELFTVGGSTLTVTSVDGEEVVPGIQYTVSAETAGGVDVTPVTQYVPDDYPVDLTSTFTLVFPPVGTLTATVTWAGQPVSGATVTVTGGPQSVTLTATTDANGVASFEVPAGSGYTVTALHVATGETATASDQTVAPDGTTNVALALPTGTIVVTAMQGGAPAEGADITLTGGPMSISVGPATTDASGQITFINVPAGSGYVATASKGGDVGSASAAVSGGGTTPVTVVIQPPTGNVSVTVTWAGLPVNAADVRLTGGPNGIDVTFPTDSSGQIVFTNVPIGSGYTVTATKSGQSATATNQTVSGGQTTSVSLALPTATLVVNVKRNGFNQSGATVIITGGPMSITASATTNFSGNVTLANVPVGSGYTVKAYKCSVSWPRSNQTTTTVAAGTNNLFVSFNSGSCPI